MVFSPLFLQGTIVIGQPGEERASEEWEARSERGERSEQVTIVIGQLDCLSYRLGDRLIEWSTSLDLFIPVQLCLILSGQVWTCSYLFKQVWSCLDKSGLVHSCSIKFHLVWTSLDLFIPVTLLKWFRFHWVLPVETCAWKHTNFTVEII